MIKNYSDLKVGDLVVLTDSSKRGAPKEYPITKVGRKFLYIGEGYREKKFTRETGYGDFGYSIFPGTLEDYEDYQKAEVMKRELISRLDRTIMTTSQVEKILEILTEV